MGRHGNDRIKTGHRVVKGGGKGQNHQAQAPQTTRATVQMHQAALSAIQKARGHDEPNTN